MLIIFMIMSCKEDIYKFPLQVITQDAKKIKATTVQAEAIMINPSDESISEKGFYFSQNDSASRILENKVVVTDTGFSYQLLALQANTEYSYFAFAKTASNDIHGPVKRFKTLAFQAPTLTTSELKNILITTSVAGGNISYDGGKPVLERGVCLSLVANPTIQDIRVQIGKGEGEFAIVLTKLKPFTNYFIRAYAINEIGVSYGNELNFKTQDYRLVTLRTIEPESVQIFEATLGGETQDAGGGEITQRGICLSRTANPTITDLNFASSTNGLGTYKIVVTQLEENTKYYVRAYAKNEKGYAYGEEKTFQTQDIRLPKVETSSVTNETFSTANIAGKLIDDGGVPILEQGFCYSKQPNPDINDQVAISPNMNLFLKNLEDGTTYYVRAFAKNRKGIGYGETIIFKTIGYTYAEVYTHEITTYTTNSAEINGKVINEGNTSVSERGICISTNRNPTIDDSKGPSGSGTGSFGYTFRNLPEGQLYYARAYAINQKGVAYGEERSVRIRLTPPPVASTPSAGGGNSGSTPPSSGGSSSAPSSQNSNDCGLKTTNTVAGNVRIGDRIQGGIVAYIFQPGDPGFISGQVHGIVAAPNDLNQPSWGLTFGCPGIVANTSASLGSGCQNTINSYNTCPRDSRAAKACLDYSNDGFDDWFLPSWEELLKLKNIANLIGGVGYNYCSSTEVNAEIVKSTPIYIPYTGGMPDETFYTDISKSAVLLVRPIRYF